MSILVSVDAYGQAPVFDETSVRAGFLFNFAKFVEWPANSAGSLDFCIVGDNRLAAYLETAVAGKTIGSRPLVVRGRPDIALLDSCGVIYIGRDKKMAAQAALMVAGKQILTVSEFPELRAQGAVINFFLDNERVKFEVHLGALRRADVKISSKLLSLARITGP